MLVASHPRRRAPEAAIASVWLLTSPETYLQLTDGLAWDPDRYEQWLRQSMLDLLLGPGAQGPGT